jgi:ubiquinone/menaquinone biosynthesis C-methylase UbiE
MDLDVFSRCQEKMTLNQTKIFLRQHIYDESKIYFGLSDSLYIDQVVENWFNDQENYDGRWRVIMDKIPKSAKILDMAAGCGTFVLYGLNKGYDVWGIEPEAWKREYFKLKIEASEYSPRFLEHITEGYGESLPFPDGSLDFITTYQTLEHVKDVNKCLDEFLRVLKPNGVLYIRAPDYNSFYEPHYRVPFLPKMNRTWAARYLRMLGKPILGLQTLNWTTQQDMIRYLKTTQQCRSIETLSQYHSQKRRQIITNMVPGYLKNKFIVGFCDCLYEFVLKRIFKLMKLGREEGVIELWVIKK